MEEARSSHQSPPTEFCAPMMLRLLPGLMHIRGPMLSSEKQKGLQSHVLRLPSLTFYTYWKFDPLPPSAGALKGEGTFRGDRQWKVIGLCRFYGAGYVRCEWIHSSGAVEQVVKEQGWLLLFRILLYLIP